MYVYIHPYVSQDSVSCLYPCVTWLMHATIHDASHAIVGHDSIMTFFEKFRSRLTHEWVMAHTLIQARGSHIVTMQRIAVHCRMLQSFFGKWSFYRALLLRALLLGRADIVSQCVTRLMVTWDMTHLRYVVCSYVVRQWWGGSMKCYVSFGNVLRLFWKRSCPMYTPDICVNTWNVCINLSN